MGTRIIKMVRDGLEPLERRMNLWPKDYQAIIWEAVMLEAKLRMEKARQ